MGRIKKILFVIAFGMIIVTMGGCVYSNNKSWSDMTSEEMQDVRQNFKEIETELREDFSGTDMEDELASLILDTVDQKIHQAN